MKKVELLAPAGDLERLKWAIDYGADAVYIGGPSLGLRANAKNFTFEEIEEGIKYAHERNKRIHVTINIALHNEEIKDVLPTLKKLKELNVDAVIVSDPAIINEALKLGIETHVSTQQSTLNYEACKFWYEQGVKRVVLGREVSKEDIIKIKQELPKLELETFIHGAMCSSFSGRCVMSNFFTNRDANRGGCAQICRWDFNLLNENLKEIKGEMPFTFCTKDLSMLNHIPEMIDMGISSFKIEGRMRSVYYIATVTSIYRKTIDRYLSDKENYIYNKEDEKILRKCANRDSITQFFDGTNDYTMGYYNGREEISNQDFIGIILDYNDSTKEATIEERNYFEKGTNVEIFGPKTKTFDYTFNEIKDEENNIIEIVRHPKQVVKIKLENKVYPNDIIRIKY